MKKDLIRAKTKTTQSLKTADRKRTNKYEYDVKTGTGTGDKSTRNGILPRNEPLLHESITVKL